MGIEQVREASTPEQMRAEINRIAQHDALTRQVMVIADRYGMSGEDGLTAFPLTCLAGNRCLPTPNA